MSLGIIWYSWKSAQNACHNKIHHNILGIWITASWDLSHFLWGSPKSNRYTQGLLLLLIIWDCSEVAFSLDAINFLYSLFSENMENWSQVYIRMSSKICWIARKVRTRYDLLGIHLHFGLSSHNYFTHQRDLSSWDMKTWGRTQKSNFLLKQLVWPNCLSDSLGPTQCWAHAGMSNNAVGLSYMEVNYCAKR